MKKIILITAAGVFLTTTPAHADWTETVIDCSTGQTTTVTHSGSWVETVWTKPVIPETPVAPTTPTEVGTNQAVYIKPDAPTQPVETTTVVMDTATAIIETPAVLSDIDFNAPDWYERFITWLNNYITQLYARLEGLKK